jgi:aspartate-semialdehyde dehydrogenase
MSRKWNIAVVGATGAVGSQLIECLEERDFPVGTVRYLASGRSAGQILEFKGKPVMVEELTGDSFAGIHIALFAGGSGCARDFCPAAARAGAVCIEGSGAWRQDPDVPLVVPEVNPQAIARYTKKGIIASPGCAATQLVVALKPLHDVAGVKRVVVTTFQAVSGSGRKAIDELQQQVGQLLNGRPATTDVFPHQIAFNCLPHTGSFAYNGYTDEELMLIEEARKIMAAEIRGTATTVRVPVFYGYGAAVNIETERKVTAAAARELLAAAPGVELVDEPANNLYPMPLAAVGQDLVQVGRLREDESIDNGLNLWVVTDNLRKGAATNMVQTAEILLRDYLR